MNIYRSIFRPPFAALRHADTFKSYLNQRRQTVLVTARETSGTSRRKSAKRQRERQEKEKKKRGANFTLAAFITYLFQSYSLCGLPFISPFSPSASSVRSLCRVVFRSMASMSHVGRRVYVCDMRQPKAFSQRSRSAPTDRSRRISRCRHLNVRPERSCRDSGCRKGKPVERKAPSLPNRQRVQNREGEKNAKGIELKAIFIFFHFALRFTFGQTSAQSETRLWGN